MKKMFLMTVFGASLLSGSASAAYYDNPSYDPCCPQYDRFYVRADYLYWRPCIGGLSTALEQKRDVTTGILFSTDYNATIYPMREGDDGDTHEERPLEEYKFYRYEEEVSFGSTSAHVSEKLKFPGDEWDSGFRLGIGYQGGGCGCDFVLNWIYYSPCDSKKVNAEGDCFLTPFNGLALERFLAGTKAGFDVSFYPTSTGFVKGFMEGDLSKLSFPLWSGCNELKADHVKSKWDLCMNVLDAEVGHMIHFGRCLSFSPHVDLRYASVEQKLSVHSEGDVVFTITGEDHSVRSYIKPIEFVLAHFEAKQKLSNDFCGIGPRAGFDAEFELGCGWGIYGNYAVSLLYGDFDSRHKEWASREFSGNYIPYPYGSDYYYDVYASTYVDNINAEDFHFKRSSCHRCSSVGTDVTIGLFWESSYCSCGTNYDIDVKIGWEHHHFSELGIADASRNDDRFKEEHNDLSTQGLTITFGLGF